MPEIESAYQDYKDKDTVVIGVDIREAEEALAAAPDEAVKEEISHIMEELAEGNLDDATHELEDWLGMDAQ